MTKTSKESRSSRYCGFAYGVALVHVPFFVGPVDAVRSPFAVEPPGDDAAAAAVATAWCAHFLPFEAQPSRFSQLWTRC